MDFESLITTLNISTIMENISLKQWIVAGVLSGAIIGLPFTLICGSLTSASLLPLLFKKDFYSFIILALISYTFIGLITGTILFFIRNMFLKARPLRCVVIATVVNFLAPMIMYPVLPSSQLGWILLFPSGQISWLVGAILSQLIPEMIWGVAFPLSLILLGIGYGFLIHFFIERMERKASK